MGPSDEADNASIVPLLRTGMEGMGRSARKIASKRNCGNLVEAGAAPLFFGALGNELARHKMNTVKTLSSISSPRDTVFRSNFATAEGLSHYWSSFRTLLTHSNVGTQYALVHAEQKRFSA